MFEACFLALNISPETLACKPGLGFKGLGYHNLSETLHGKVVPEGCRLSAEGPAAPTRLPAREGP